VTRILIAALGSMLLCLVGCTPTRPTVLERQVLVRADVPDCDPLPVVWAPDFEAFGKPASDLLREFDAREDALKTAQAELKCWRDWRDNQPRN
jgi:hypothetical protein